MVDLSRDTVLDSVPVDLADVYEVCRRYEELVEKLIAQQRPWTKARLLPLVNDIYDTLYIHLPYHHKRLSRGLRKLSVALEPNERKRDALADRRLQSTLRKGKKIIEKLKAEQESSSQNEE